MVICRVCRVRGTGHSFHGYRPQSRRKWRNASLTCRYARAAYRNRTDDLRITRGMRPACARASCTDSTCNGEDGTRGAGIILRPGPRTGPRPEPSRASHLATVRYCTEGYPRPQADPAVIGVTGPARVYRTQPADVHNCRNSAAGAFTAGFPGAMQTAQPERRCLPNRGEARRLRMMRCYEQLVTD